MHFNTFHYPGEAGSFKFLDYACAVQTRQPKVVTSSMILCMSTCTQLNLFPKLSHSSDPSCALSILFLMENVPLKANGNLFPLQNALIGAITEI